MYRRIVIFIHLYLLPLHNNLLNTRSNLEIKTNITAHSNDIFILFIWRFGPFCALKILLGFTYP